MLGDRRPGYIGEDLQFLAAGAAEQFVDGFADRLSKDVPQRNIDAAQRGRQDRPRKMGVARHRLEMMIDGARIATDKIVREIIDRFEDKPVVRPEPGLASADSSASV